MINILYVAHGRRMYRRAATFSMLTFLHHAASLETPFRIVVYTDRPEDFTRHGIPCETHAMTDLRSPPSVPSFPFWPKLTAFAHCAEAHDGAVLYVDTDTYFIRSPHATLRRLSERESLMHTYEWPLTAPDDEAFAADITDPPLMGTQFVTDTLRRLETLEAVAMWNAGVVGLHESNLPLVTEVIAVCEELLRFYTSHTVEQLAWSLVLQAHTQVLPADSVVCHYWDRDRLAIEYAIVHFLRKHGRLPLDILAARAAGLDPAERSVSEPPSLELRARRNVRRMRNAARDVRARLSAL